MESQLFRRIRKELFDHDEYRFITMKEGLRLNGASGMSRSVMEIWHVIKHRVKYVVFSLVLIKLDVEACFPT